MTVANQTNRTSATGSGSTGQEVAFNFPISATTDLAVYKRVTATGVQTTLTETTNYTVTISGDTGGTLTTVTAIETTEQIHIVRATPYTQSLDLEAGGTFNAELQEDAFDKNTKLILQLKDRLDRILRFPATDPAASVVEMPSSVDRAGKYLYFGATNGEPTTADSITPSDVVVSTFMETVVDDTNAGVARRTLGIYYDVVGYGATGDGSTDDTTAIQDAIDAANTAGGGMVYFPPGTYIISAVLTLYSNVTLMGESRATSIIYLADSTDTQMTFASAKNDIRILHLTLDGNNDNSNTKVISWFRACSRCEIAYCKLTNTDLQAIYLVSSTTTNCENNTFHHNIIDDTGSQGIVVKAQGDDSDTKDTLYTKVNYNYFYDCDYSAVEANGQYCHYTEIIGNIAFECVAGVYEADKGCSDVIIANNIAVDSIEHATLGSFGTIRAGDGGTTVTAKRIIVKNNLIIGDSTEEVWGIHFKLVEDSIIEGNIIFDTGHTTEGGGIFVSSTPNRNIQILGNYIEDSEFKGIYIDTGAERVVISGNTVLDTLGEGIGSKSPAIITNNHCEEANTSGIYLQSAASRSIISNNICKNCNNAASGTRGGIQMADVSYCNVTGNICYDDQTTKTQNYGIYVHGTSIGNIIKDNITRGNLTGDTSIVSGNRLGYEKEIVINEGGVVTNVNEVVTNY